MIGAEREYRASPAGFRTHILVALSSALLMLSAVHQIRWLTDTPTDIIRIDPVRMAHGVLTGIGFLCGGVIFREGFTVRGLTTAASLWTTSALGILFGVGFYSLAIAGTFATLAILAATAITERLLPQKKVAELIIRYRRCPEDSYAAVMGLITRHDINPFFVSERMEGEIYELTATVSWKKAGCERALAAALQVEANVIGFDLTRR
jgi:putative Mg2+ transporter-C (MgtC) family protein